MHKLGRGSRDKLQQFMAITGSNERTALQALKASDWHLEGAFDYFYSQPHVRSVVDSRQIEALYNRYKDPYADMILVDGISLLCNDLQVDPQDIVMLVLSWHMKAATMCEFSKQEFVGGLQSLGVDSIERLREKIPLMRAELKDDQKFREIYNFAFAWAKEKGQKSLALDTAIGMWQLMFAEKLWPLVDHWCDFLQARHNKAISRDTWSQLLEFSKVLDSIAFEIWVFSPMYQRSTIQSFSLYACDEAQHFCLELRHVRNHLTFYIRNLVGSNYCFCCMQTIDPQLSNYDSEGAWPYLIDEFVEYLFENGVVQRSH